MSFSLLLRKPSMEGMACLLRFYSVQGNFLVLSPPILSFFVCHTRVNDGSLLSDLVSIELQIANDLIQLVYSEGEYASAYGQGNSVISRN